MIIMTSRVVTWVVTFRMIISCINYSRDNMRRQWLWWWSSSWKEQLLYYLMPSYFMSGEKLLTQVIMKMTTPFFPEKTLGWSQVIYISRKRHVSFWNTEHDTQTYHLYKRNTSFCKTTTTITIIIILIINLKLNYSSIMSKDDARLTDWISTTVYCQ